MIEQDGQMTPEEAAVEVRRLAERLVAADRKDLLLHAIGVPLLEELRIEAARGKLSRLVITRDYRFILEDYQQEVEASCSSGWLHTDPRLRATIIGPRSSLEKRR